MTQPRKTALTTAALLLTAAMTLGAAGAQTITGTTGTATAHPNVLFLADTGRAGAVDVEVDGTQIQTNVRASDRASALRLTPGTHAITVKASVGGATLATTTLNVMANSLYAVSLQNDEDTMGYELALASGDTAVRTAVNVH
ncbi:DUF4397 domain-containing protein [Deinococcus sp. YIM 134068]|uniref:DUF4397 domain-containing protein n=1 Tax=Deinococcus lichenicola TaxID=3118910 RepID=UPI002F937371